MSRRHSGSPSWLPRYSCCLAEKIAGPGYALDSSVLMLDTVEMPRLVN